MSQMTELSPQHYLGDFQLGRDNDMPVLELGQTVVISAGALQGAMVKVVKKVAGGHWLVSLGEQNEDTLAKLPSHLLRETD